MDIRPSDQESYLSQLRLLLEELCSDLCRFELVSQCGLAPESIRIDREFDLGIPGAFADIRVAAPNQAPFFVEIKYGYSNQILLRHMQRKYGAGSPHLEQASKVILVVVAQDRPDWPKTEAELAGCLQSGLKLEVWNEQRLLALLHQRFGIAADAITEKNLLEVRQAVDRAKGLYAFGGTSVAEYHDEPLKSELLWYFGFWRLRQLREARALEPRDILPPGLYRGVVVVLADLCGFSSYVRDTRDDQVVRHSLTSFYSKGRYQVINQGGMLYQFVGDEIIGLFGVPEPQPDHVQAALSAAKSLLSIGLSVSNHWQQRIDRVQASSGLHIGIAMGDLQVVSLRPVSRTRIGVIGDPINVAARLMTAAGPSEIVVSNAFYNELNEESQAEFQESENVDAHNVGRIRAWKLRGKEA